ncbi:type II secretion system major pseudopilin GspG [Piscinibacterium candidicorallinum]|uniref:Type II secretion system core protein G n=1 Tax=Piscinibacterium candidicorallinum TaxID=1793872 RepID=A0ABV7H887_9BURK
MSTSITFARRARGFTLIEIMVVITIIAVIAAFAAPRILGRSDDARRKAAGIEITTMKRALQMYYLDNNNYPTTQQGLQALVAKPTVAPIPNNWKAGGYVEKLNPDPWGNPYQYLKPGLGGAEFEIFSYGADGKPGGEGKDEDITSSKL